jgi:peptide/nickel transport system permease protein
MAEVGAARIQPTVVRESVMHYLSASESDLPAAKERLRVHGGLVMEPLMAAMRRDVQTTARVADALETVTGIAYRDDDEALIRERWESWWRRNRVDFEMPGGFESATRIISDTQFGVWIGQVVRLDFGESYSSRRPVSRMIAEALPVSLLLSVLSILFSYILSIPIGVYSALHRHTPADRVVTIILFVLYSLPSFWVAGILIMTMTGPPLALFPTRGLASPDLTLAADWSNLGTWFLDRVWHLILPVFCLTYGSLAFISRQMRSAMLETINQDYIRTAIAKGLDPKRVVWVHAVRNSLLPIITISAGILPELIAGAIIIESIFTIPGMGSLTFSAIMNRDYPVINAVLFLSAFLTLLGILLADLAYSLADPRIEYR